MESVVQADPDSGMAGGSAGFQRKEFCNRHYGAAIRVGLRGRPDRGPIFTTPLAQSTRFDCAGARQLCQPSAFLILRPNSFKLSDRRRNPYRCELSLKGMASDNFRQCDFLACRRVG